MLVDSDSWEKIVSNMGISKNDRIVIYDNSDVISSCRCWFNFIYFGHDPQLVHVLNGGLRKWISEKKELVKDKKLIEQNINEQNFRVIDARSTDRFEGKVQEPREGLRSGNIKNSFCIPFNRCLNKNKTFKDLKELRSVFKSCLKDINEQNVVFSCGSGVTACVLALAYSLINDKYRPCIYDGSWAEYGLI